jgi:chromosome segregation ATPase
MAMQAKMQRHQKEIDTYTEKVAAVNSRYQVLKEKLENEWNQELLSLDDDKAKSFTEFKVSEARLYEIETKLEAYRIEDHNLKVDRWSLDPEIYVKK